MAGKYLKIQRTPTFMAAYSEMRYYLRRSSPLAFLALPSAMKAILDVIDNHPRSWPIKRKRLGGAEHEFHLAIIDIAYRRLHLRYYVDAEDVSHLSAVWVDGHDEPNYRIGNREPGKTVNGEKAGIRDSESVNAVRSEGLP